MCSRIQNTIREEFKESILITIAHRLRTVIGEHLVLFLAQCSAELDTFLCVDYDRVLVLDAGEGERWFECQGYWSLLLTHITP